MKGSSIIKLLLFVNTVAQIDSIQEESRQSALVTKKTMQLIKTLTSGHFSEEGKVLQRKYKTHVMQGDEILDALRSLNKRKKAHKLRRAIDIFVAIFAVVCMVTILALVAFNTHAAIKDIKKINREASSFAVKRHINAAL